ncbi:helix-turn-helix transcriptional regulator [Paenalcaligenes hominis]|uniref:AraC family transcriptional regulator n=1 Tax=Paenalcaligenes hominis TaxID=643674 RepID=UPI0035242DC3
MTNFPSLRHSLSEFDPDTIPRPAVALRVEVANNSEEQPEHRHQKGQLIMAVRGGVTCQVPSALWMVPPQHAVWIPSQMPHSSFATANAKIYFLLIEVTAASMPTECCTLALPPHVREMIRYLAQQDPLYNANSATERLVTVLLEQLTLCDQEKLCLPISTHPKIHLMTQRLLNDPSDRTTLANWAQQLAMSDRTLARLLVKETGLSFGKWRQQLHLLIALQLLAAGTAVQTVAGHLGYDSVTAFITMFKKSLGKAPTHYFAALQASASEQNLAKISEKNSPL